MLTVKIVLSSVAPPCEQIGSRLMNVKWFDFVKLKVDIRNIIKYVGGWAIAWVIWDQKSFDKKVSILRPRKKSPVRWQPFAERKFSCPMSEPVLWRSNQENNSKLAKFDPLGASRWCSGAKVIFEFKISLKMVAKSRSRTSSFRKRARFRLGNMLRSNGR